MSLLDQYSQNILQFKGNLLEAQDLIKAFIAEIMIKIFSVEQKFQQQVFRNCNKNWKIVEQNLLNYFQSFQLPIQNIFNENKYQNEGFISSDDEQAINTNKKKVEIKRTKSIFKENIKQDDFKDEQIRIRDQVIQDMTIGYYKDVQHLKEMFLRKERQQDDDIFDVTYYDITKSFPQEVQFYIAQKIKEMTNQAKKEQTKLQTQITQQQFEIEKLKKTINQLISQSDIIQQIKAILILDRDLNRFWRGIQDVIGNRQIFEIFEKRIAGYGIDYKQIDELISQSQASFRVFQDFKQKIDEQYLQLSQSMQKEINLLKNQIKILNDNHNGVLLETEKDFIQIRQTLKSGIEYIYEMKEKQLRISYQQQLEQFIENTTSKEILISMKKCIKGHALYKWMYLSIKEKLQKQQKLKKSCSFHIIKQDYQINLRGLIDNRVNNLKQQLKQRSYQLANEQLQTQQLEVELNQLKTKYQQLLINYEMQLHKYLYLQQNTQYLENQNKYFEKIFQLLMRKIGYSNFEVNERNIHLILEKSDQQMKHFYNKINLIQQKDYEDIMELTNQLIKKSIFRNKLNQNQKTTSFCQTDIFDVSIQLEKSIKNAQIQQQQLLEIIYKQENEVQQEQQLQQENLEINDIPNIMLSDNEEQEQENKELKLVNKISFERSTDIDINRNNSIETDLKYSNPPKSAENKIKSSQQFTFLSRKKTTTFSTRSKEVQTEIQVDCSLNLVNKIFINDLDEFKKNVKEKPSVKEMRKTPQQSKPDLQNTFATLISQQNASKVRKQINLFQSIKHKPIEINCLQKLKTDVSSYDIDPNQNITFTNDKMRLVFTSNKKKGRSISKNI